ncbi:hypothetical protein RMSM_07758 [Rhodopirellula maiorica SM1]|uniref:Uncharacterized protein n=1 Tax=Rhodopirellula maiorica SM1 TaxID=1265738 RepID=M5R7H0_9BACT|nr:hypothetical protein RMSM_07758 [Rhodopirellula maiorica SM1]
MPVMILAGPEHWLQAFDAVARRALDALHVLECWFSKCGAAVIALGLCRFLI